MLVFPGGGLSDLTTPVHGEQDQTEEGAQSFSFGNLMITKL